mmetsp:Transcript_15119/g.28447  ORF Transcript_15119/g.28447 Transcript_15119/m.28447 type:complete len:95 (+) Transcript_15119:381-665(+)
MELDLSVGLEPRCMDDVVKGEETDPEWFDEDVPGEFGHERGMVYYVGGTWIEWRLECCLHRLTIRGALGVLHRSKYLYRQSVVVGLTGDCLIWV